MYIFFFFFLSGILKAVFVRVYCRLINLQKSRLLVRHGCIDLLLFLITASGLPYGSLHPIAVDLYFCLLRRSTEQPAGHKTGMKETAVAYWHWSA